jgi:hypothetical protein
MGIDIRHGDSEHVGSPSAAPASGAHRPGCHGRNPWSPSPGVEEEVRRGWLSAGTHQSSGEVPATTTAAIVLVSSLLPLLRHPQAAAYEHRALASGGGQ